MSELAGHRWANLAQLLALVLLSASVGGGCHIHRSVEPPPSTDVNDRTDSDDRDGSTDSGECGDVGDACDDGDALDCTGVCTDNGCEPEVRDGQCLIAGSCLAADDANPANSCEVCAPESSQDDWTIEEGASCGGGPPCSCSAEGVCERPNGSEC